ncbi:MAG TPA: DUF4236 domain-containing protein [Rickettsiales bacterium]|nr:DUF4236 domain-containing protein [Rickettsiales bacterium]
MGLRFHKAIKILPGVHLNLSKSGASISLGEKGVSYNIGTKGARTTVGLPGSGLSYSKFSSYSKIKNGGISMIAIWIVIGAGVAALVMMR